MVFVPAAEEEGSRVPSKGDPPTALSLTKTCYSHEAFVGLLSHRAPGAGQFVLCSASKYANGTNCKNDCIMPQII